MISSCGYGWLSMWKEAFVSSLLIVLQDQKLFAVNWFCYQLGYEPLCLQEGSELNGCLIIVAVWLVHVHSHSNQQKEPEVTQATSNCFHLRHPMEIKSSFKLAFLYRPRRNRWFLEGNEYWLLNYGTYSLHNIQNSHTSEKKLNIYIHIYIDHRRKGEMFFLVISKNDALKVVTSSYLCYFLWPLTPPPSDVEFALGLRWIWSWAFHLPVDVLLPRLGFIPMCWPCFFFGTSNIMILGGGNSNGFGIFTPTTWGKFPIWQMFFKWVETAN